MEAPKTVERLVFAAVVVGAAAGALAVNHFRREKAQAMAAGTAPAEPDMSTADYTMPTLDDFIRAPKPTEATLEPQPRSRYEDALSSVAKDIFK